jgi:hypothetical protein
LSLVGAARRAPEANGDDCVQDEGCVLFGPQYQGAIVIVLGIILLIIGFLAKIPIVWTLGIIVLVVGLVLALLGSTGRPVRGRRHYF